MPITRKLTVSTEVTRSRRAPRVRAKLAEPHTPLTASIEILDLDPATELVLFDGIAPRELAKALSMMICAWNMGRSDMVPRAPSQ